MSPEEAIRRSMDLYHAHPDYKGPVTLCDHAYLTLSGVCVVCGAGRAVVEGLSWVTGDPL